MIARLDPLVTALEDISSAGGTVFPRWSPGADAAVAYVAGERELDLADLERLVERDLLRRVYVDRVSRCPSCQSHHLNVREICTTCHSSRISSAELLHHFRCGYVAPAYEFALEENGRRCPKCHALLRNRGSDHDVPGPHFVCEACAGAFQVPEIGLLCLACGTHTHGNDLEKVLYQDVFGFVLTSRGTRAAASGHASDVDRSARTPDGSPILERTAFLALLEDERKRSQLFRTDYSLLSIICTPPNGDDRADEGAFAEALRNQLTAVDKIGRCDDGNLMVLMPCTNDRHAHALARRLNESTDQRLRAWKLQARAVSKNETAWTEVPVIRGVVPLGVDV